MQSRSVQNVFSTWWVLEKLEIAREFAHTERKFSKQFYACAHIKLKRYWSTGREEEERLFSQSKCRTQCTMQISVAARPWKVNRVIARGHCMLFPDAFSTEVLIPTCSLHSEFAATLVASRPEDAFIDLIASWILGATLLSITVQIAFWILSSTVSTKLFSSLSILSLKHFSKVLTFTAFSLVAELLLEVPMVKSRSLVPSLTIVFPCLSLGALPIIISGS